MTTLDLAAIEADLERQLDRTRRMPTEPMIGIRAETLRGLIAAAKSTGSAEIRGLKMALKIARRIWGASCYDHNPHGAWCIMEAISARIAELKERASQLEKRCVLTMKEQS